jgi:TRAP transporter TAXI family solute receptor
MRTATPTRTRPSLKAALATIGAIVLAVTILVVTTRPNREWPGTIRIATATPGGTYDILGGEFAGLLRARILADPPNRRLKDAKAIPTDGSFENIELLTRKDETPVELAFVALPSLADSRTTRAQRSQIGVLASLYRDVVQIVFRTDLDHDGNTIPDIQCLSDLRGKSIYIGRRDSATRLIARKVLESAGLEPTDYRLTPDAESWSYEVAARKLLEGRIDAAFFAGGTPTPAVSDALSGPCALLGLEKETIEKLLQEMPVAEPAVLPPHFYEGHDREVKTVQTPVYLVCRRHLPDDLAVYVLDTLFDNVGRLLPAVSGVGNISIAVHDIKVQNAFPRGLPPGLRLHRGAAHFEEDEQKKLLIATGAITGRYYDMGKRIQYLLEMEGIPARVIHTDGSSENASLLQTEARRHTLAILQYDIALDACKRNPHPIYRDPTASGDGRGVPIVDGMFRIATLHEEKVHIVVRREALPQPNAPRPTAELLRGLNVCLGPKGSGTRMLAEAILDHHAIDLDDGRKHELSARDMVTQLRSRKIDAGFLVAGAPSTALKGILSDDSFRLLSIGPRVTMKLTDSTAALRSVELPPLYGCQRDDEEPIQTLATDAVLVTTDDLEYDVAKITETILAGAGFVGIDGGEDRMKIHTASLPLHPDAVTVYRERGHLPAHSKMSFLEIMAHLLAIAVIVYGGTKGIRMLLHERIGNDIKRRILDISLDVVDRDSVGRLTVIRNEVRRRARMEWWHLEQLDRARWQDLEGMIDRRVQEAMSKRVKAILDEVRSMSDQDRSSWARRRASLREEIWRYAHNGDLSASDMEVVLRAFDDYRAEKVSG